ncbi:O-methyltransferase [Frateuria aurantia]
MAFEHIQQATRIHRRKHGCYAYTYSDGEALTALVKKTNAYRILELGTALGYTACCLASASRSVRVDTIDMDHAHVVLARDNIRQAGMEDRIFVHEGDFHDVLKCLSTGYDFIFFDGVAPELTIVEKLRELLIVGGMLACGNLHMADSVVLRDFSNSKRWFLKEKIENGDTGAFIKI